MDANPLTIRAGDDHDILVEVTTKDEETGVETPRDITGYDFYFTLKRSPAKPDSDAIATVDWSDHIAPESGQTMLVLPRSITAEIAAGRYNYDIQCRSADDKITTLVAGECVVLTQTTRRT